MPQPPLAGSFRRRLRARWRPVAGALLLNVGLLAGLAWGLRAASPAASAAPAPAAGPALDVTLVMTTTAECQASLQGQVGGVCNGAPVTYTLGVRNTGGIALNAIAVVDSLPADARQNIALRPLPSSVDYGCRQPACETVFVTQTIRSPFDDAVEVSQTIRLRWTVASLSVGQAVTVTFTGLIAGQSEGAQVTNRVVASSLEGAVGTQVAVATVHVLPGSQRPGAYSLADSPIWFSSDIGGTFSQDWGDFNQDGALDLALGSSNGVSIYAYDRAQGDLSLMAITETITPALGVVWANVMGDQRLELIVVGGKEIEAPLPCLGTACDPIPARNYIYGYDANGVFGHIATFTSTLQLARVVAGPFTGTVSSTSARDLIVSVNAINFACHVFLLPNQGGAAPFQWGKRQCLSDHATAAIAAGDVNNDNHPDLALGLFPNQAAVLLGAPAGLGQAAGFTTTPLLLEKSVSYVPYDLVFGDYDRDGFLDVAAAYPLLREVRIYHNQQGLGFELSKILRTDTFFSPLALSWHDFDGDGWLDLAVADERLKIYRNLRGATPGVYFKDLEFLAAGDFGGASQVWSLRTVKPAAAENAVLAATNRDGSSMLFGVFTPRLAPTLTPVRSAPAASVAWGAWTPGGPLGLLFGAGGLQAGTEFYARSSPGAPFARVAQFATDQSVRVSLADVNADGVLEFGLGQLARNSLMQMQGGVPVEIWDTPDPPFANHVLGWGDVNADGLLDVLVGAQDGPVLLYRNLGGVLNATPGLTLTPPNGWSAVRALAWANWQASRYASSPVPYTGPDYYPGFAAAYANGPGGVGGVAVYENKHDGTFQLAWAQPLTGVTDLAWANFNHQPDGYPSLAVSTQGAGTYIFENVSAAGGQTRTFAQVWKSDTLSNTRSLAWGDWDNDGYPDLALGNAGAPSQVFANEASAPGTPRLFWVWSSAEAYSVTKVAWGDAAGTGYPDLAVSQDGAGPSGYYPNTLALAAHTAAVFTPTLTLPDLPLYVAVQQPGRTASANPWSSAEILARPGTTTTLPITYQVYAPAASRAPGLDPGLALVSTTFEFSLDGGAQWWPAKPAAGLTPTVPQSATRAGASGRFFWDTANADSHGPIISDEARFRVTVWPNLPSGPAPAAAVAGVSPAFRVRSVDCYWPRDPQIAGPRQVALSTTVALTGFIASGSGSLTYLWTFGDTPTATVLGQSVQHVFRRNGTYHVQLTVTGQTGPARTNPVRCPVNPPAGVGIEVAAGTGVPDGKLYFPLMARNAAPGVTPAAAGLSGRPEAAARVAPLAVAAAAAAPVLLRPAAAAQPTASVGTICPALTGDQAVTDRHILVIPASQGGVSNEPAVGGLVTRTVTAFSGSVDPCSPSNANGNIEIFVAYPDQNGQPQFAQVTSSTGGVLGGFNLGPSLNLTGTRLTFFSDRDLVPSFNPFRTFQIFAAQLDLASTVSPTVLITQVTVGGRTANILPAISADGRFAAYLANDDQGRSQVMRADLDQAVAGVMTATSVSENLAGINLLPAISADGSRIAYGLPAGGQTNAVLQVWTLSGGAPVTRSLPVSGQVLGLALSGNSDQPARLAYLAQQADGQAYLAYWDLPLNGNPSGPVVLARYPNLRLRLSNRPVISVDGERLAHTVTDPDSGLFTTVVNYLLPNLPILTRTLALSATDVAPAVGFDPLGTQVGVVISGGLLLAQHPFIRGLATALVVEPNQAFAAAVNLTMTVTNTVGPSVAEGVAISATFDAAADFTYLGEVTQTDDLSSMGAGHVVTNLNFVPGVGLVLTGTRGVYTSRVLAAPASVGWQTLSWSTDRPLGKPLPDNQALTEPYSTATVSMANNTFLLHLDESLNAAYFKNSAGAGGVPNSYFCWCYGAGAPGRFNRGLAFRDSALQYFYLPSSGFFQQLQGTLEFWVQAPLTGTLLSTYSCGTGYCFWDPVLAVDDSRTALRVGLRPDNYAGVWPATLVSWNNAPAWHHLALVLNGNRLDLYIDGVDATPSGIDPGNLWLRNSSLYYRVFYLGVGPGGLTGISANPSYSTFGGVLDEVAYYSGRALDAGQIAARYARGATRLQLRVRACVKSDCSDAGPPPFVGPAGPASYFSEEANVDPVTPTVALAPDFLRGQYIQYEATLEADQPVSNVLTLKDLTMGLRLCTQPQPPFATAGLTRTVVLCQVGALAPGDHFDVLLRAKPRQSGTVSATLVLTRAPYLVDQAYELDPQVYTLTSQNTLMPLSLTGLSLTVQPPAAQVTLAQPVVITAAVLPVTATPQFKYQWTWVNDAGTSLSALTLVTTTAANAVTRSVAFADFVDPGVYTLTVVATNTLPASLPLAGPQATLVVTVTNPGLALDGVVPITPAAIVSGTVAPNLKVRVKGTGFVASTKVQLDGNALSPLDRNCPNPCDQITFTLSTPAALSFGAHTVTVSNTAGGSGATGDTTTFTVLTPTLVLTPATVLLLRDFAGQPTATLTAAVSGGLTLQADAQVTTSVGPGGVLTVPPVVVFPSSQPFATWTITANLTGTASVTFTLPVELGGQPALPVTVTVNNPPPALTAASPPTLTAGAVTTTLTVAGQHFVEGTQVFWNGAALTSTGVTSAGSLTATLFPSQIGVLSRTLILSVTNPAPGGGVSNNLFVTVTNPSLSLAGAPAILGVGSLVILSAHLAGDAQAQPATATLTATPASGVLIAPLSLTFPLGGPDPTFSVTGLVAGSTTVTATLNVFTGVAAGFLTTVVAPPLTLTPASATLATGASLSVTVAISPTFLQAGDRVITLTTAPAGQVTVTVPATVTLLAGDSVVTVPITADNTLTGTVLISGTLPVEAGGLSSGDITITVP